MSVSLSLSPAWSAVMATLSTAFVLVPQNLARGTWVQGKGLVPFLCSVPSAPKSPRQVPIWTDRVHTQMCSLELWGQ